MKSARLKQASLAVLLLIAGYIWWGNFRLFCAPKNETSPIGANKGTAEKTPRSTSLEYQDPKINPFQRFEVVNTPPISAQSRSTPAVRAPEMVSGRYRLVGVVLKSDQSQAVFMEPDSGTIILTLGDSLLRWQLLSIRDTVIVFGNEKRRDTIRLSTM